MSAQEIEEKFGFTIPPPPAGEPPAWSPKPPPSPAPQFIERKEIKMVVMPVLGLVPDETREVPESDLSNFELVRRKKPSSKGVSGVTKGVNNINDIQVSLVNMNGRLQVAIPDAYEWKRSEIQDYPMTTSIQCVDVCD